VRWVTTPYPVAIANPWNTTLMPVEFRWKMFAMMTANTAALCLWQYFFVNGFLATKLVAMKKTADSSEEPFPTGGDARSDESPTENLKGEHVGNVEDTA